MPWHHVQPFRTPAQLAQARLFGMRRGPRFVFRYAARLRREGGSLAITVPRYIVRRWRLEPGDELLIRSTEEGILMAPRFPDAYVRLEFSRNRSGERQPLQP